MRKHISRAQCPKFTKAGLVDRSYKAVGYVGSSLEGAE